MIRSTDIIKTLNDYNASVSLVAFPFNMHVVPAELNQAADFLRTLLQNTKGDTVQLADYNQMQQYMQANSILTNIVGFPPANSLKKITKWHIHKFMLPEDEQVKIVLFETILETQKKWQENERYLQIPKEFTDQADYVIYQYREELKKLPPEKQDLKLQQLKMLDILKDPKALFDRAKISATNGLIALVNLFNEKHHEKETLIKHVYIDLFHDLNGKDYLQKEMINGYLQIERWLTSGIDDSFRIDQKALEKTMNKFMREMELSGKRAAQEREAKDKKEDAEVSAKIKSLNKEAETIQETDPELQAKAEMKRVANQTFAAASQTTVAADDTTDYVARTFDGLREFNIQPTINEAQQIATKTQEADQRNDTAIVTSKLLIDQLNKMQS